MPRISFTENLRRHIEVPPTTAEGATVGEALHQVFAAHPRLRSYIVDDQGRVRKHVTIFLNNE
ncbi:MAG: hypothetical protein PVI23_12900, partial [Maricaulaceae bacterium]